MIFDDVKKRPIRTHKGIKQTTYSHPSIIRVACVDPYEETESGWYCQAIQATDETGDLATLNYFFKDEASAVELTECGDQLYKVKYRPDEDLFICVPLSPPPVDNTPAPTSKNVWEEKDLRITKMSCIKSAIAYLGLHPKLDPEAIDTGDIKKIAEVFRKYVYNEPIE